MHPIERLRWIARAGEDPVEPLEVLAVEAARTLAELAVAEPAAAVTAARRLTERHPSNGPLWWAVKRVLESDDPIGASIGVMGALSATGASRALSRAISARIVRGSAICALVPGPLLATALERRPGYRVRLVGEYRALAAAVAGTDLEASAVELAGYEARDAPEALEGAAVLLFEPQLAGPAGFLVDPVAAEVLGQASRSKARVWALVGPGRVLSAEDAGRAAGLAGGSAVLLAPESADLVVDADGPAEAALALARETSAGPG